MRQARQRLAINLLHALRNLAKAQRFGTGYFQRRGDHRFRKGSWPATVMAAHEGAYTAVAPCVSPVVDRLVADAKLLSDHLRLDLAPEMQQARCTRVCSGPVIDRKLLQCDFLDSARVYHALHPLPRLQEAARLFHF